MSATSSILNAVTNARVATLALATVACALSVAGNGCLFLDSDGTDRNAVELRVLARVDRTDATERGTSCPDPFALLEDIDSLTGHAVVSYTRPGSSVRTPAGSGPLQVRRVGDDGTLELTGDMDVDVGPAGSEYRIAVTLRYQGMEIVGTYAGDMELESGIGIEITSLDLAAASGARGVETLDASICLRSEAVDGGELFCHPDGAPAASVEASYEVARNLLTIRYTSDDVVEWDGETREGIVVEILAGLVPTPIFEGQGRIPFLVPGGTDPVEVPIILLEPRTIPPRHPQDVLERLDGSVLIHFADGLAPRERGGVALRRTTSGCL